MYLGWPGSLKLLFPKSQNHEMMLPVERSVNSTISGEQPAVGVAEKSALGCANAAVAAVKAKLITKTFGKYTLCDWRTKVRQKKPLS